MDTIMTKELPKTTLHRIKHVLLLYVFLTVYMGCSAPVEIPDENFAEIVRHHIRLEGIKLDENKPIREKHLKKVESLFTGRVGIRDLTGIEKMPNLKRLGLDYHQIVDITPLAHLTQLQELSLNGNPIEDFTPLSNLTQLKALHISRNQIENLEPLTKLKQLTELDLSHNQIENLEPLINLKQLTDLDLFFNKVRNITPIGELTQLVSPKFRI